MPANSVEVLFFWLPPEGWIAVGTALLALSTAVLAIATIALVIIGRNQIIELRAEAKKERTLAYCDRYDTDPVLDQCLRNLGILREKGELAKSAAVKADVTTVLNYLDGLAVGITQGLYIEKFARDHMEPIVIAHVDQYLGEKSPTLGINKRNFDMLIALSESWSKSSKSPPQTLYKDGAAS